MQTTATYFDGLSSMPRQVDIYFDDRNNELLFLSSDFFDKKWDVNNVDLQVLDHCIEISIKSNSLELLKISNKNFISYFVAKLKTSGHLSLYQRILHFGLKIHIAIAILLCTCIGLGYFYLIPWVGEKSASMIPVEFDDYLSNEFLIDYLAKNNVDTVKSELLTEFASKLDLNNTKPLTFLVVKSDEINAFALPNAKIIVFTGLLEKMHSYNELVALLGHEAVHINNRHTIKMLSRNLAGYIFISAMFSDVNGIMTVIAQNAENLQALSYSRKFENEADTQGLNLVIRNKVNPRGMVSLFQRIKKEEKVLPAFLSTHPVTEDRINAISVQLHAITSKTIERNDLNLIFKRLKQ